MKKYSKKICSRITTDELKTARFDLGGINQEQAATLCGVTVATIKRWETGRGRIPKAAYELIQYAAAGALPAVAGAGWHGWRFVKGKLTAPNGYQFTAGEVMNMPYLYQLAHIEKKKAL